MRSLIVLVLAFALALADDTLIRKRRHHMAGNGGYGFGQAGARIDAQEMMLAQLNKEIEDLESRVNGDDNNVPAAMEQLANRVDHLEGNPCNKHEQQCGGASGQCISKLMFCDGRRDCENGHDESDDTCVNAVPAGRSWTGNAEWTSCLIRSNNVMTILITGNKRFDFFRPRLFVDAVIIERYTRAGEQVEENWSASGQYDFADKRVILNPPQGSTARVGMVCTDAGSKTAYCEFVRESDGYVCGSATLTRE